MKRALLLGVATIMAAVFGVGGIPTQAQSIQYVSNDEPTIVNNECSVSNSGGSTSENTANLDESTSLPGGTISYQEGSTSPIITDTSIYPNISYTPRTATTDTTGFYQDTISITSIKDTSYYPTKIYASTTNTTDGTLNYQDTASFYLINDTTQYPTLSVRTSTSSSYPSINYQINEPNTNETVSVESTNTCTAPIDSENITVNEPIIVDLRSISANLSVNDEYILYVNYGDNATVKWESEGTSNCSLDAIGQSGTEGEYVLSDITSNVAITIECEAAPGYANYQITPDWLAKVEVKVLPPTFEYLESYLSRVQPSSKKVNLKSTSNFIDQAKRALEKGSTGKAQSFLLKSIDSIKQQDSKGLSANVIEEYVDAVNYLSSTLPVTVVIASDGCSVTANGTPGLILEFGGNVNMRRGYTEQAVIPEEGIITKDLYTQNGWTATGEVVDSTGRIYARDTTDVTTDDCPEPPFIYDPSLYNGYPEKWGAPEPGTVIDDWGYYNKTAESYVAFRITDSGRTFPTNYGNASDWFAKATEDLYTAEHPQAGDIAINTLDAEFGGPVAWHVDSVDDLGNLQMSAIRSDGNMIWSSGTVEEFSHLQYIRLPSEPPVIEYTTARGEVIGSVGSTGFSTGPHIHFQVYKDGVTVNPSAGGTSLINDYGWPLLNGGGYISQSYGCVAPAWYYATQCNGGLNSFHDGLDIAANAYTPVIAVADGDITFQGCRAGLGYTIIMSHGNGWETWYTQMVTPDGQVYGYC